MRKKQIVELAVVVAAVSAAMAAANETITYSYDARGRLVQVSHQGTINNGVIVNYQYDKADNRTRKQTTGAP